ncbi:MAG TPA: sensor histidine kinase [Candidatus Limnocylindria bacterium]|nr:sensor histidine kinase [Candidatus Limnocylindria bacterium]
MRHSPYTCGLTRRAAFIGRGSWGLVFCWLALLVGFADFARAATWEVDWVCFHSGDDLGWKSPEYEDRSWEILPPKLGDWLPMPRGERFGWYRIHFRADALPMGMVAVSVGYVGTVSEIYLNGELIGGEGVWDPVRVPPPRTVHAGYVLAERLRKGPNATNILAVRVRQQIGRGGLLGGPTGLYPLAEFLHKKRDAEVVREAARISGVAICLAWAAVLWLLQRIDPAAGWLRGALFPTIMLAAAHALYSRTAEVMGLPLLVTLILIVQVAMPLALYGFIRQIRPTVSRWLDWLAWLSPLGLVVGVGVVKGEMTGVAVVYAAYFLTVWAAGAESCIQAWRAGVASAAMYLGAWVAIGATSLLDFSTAWSDWIPTAAMWFTSTDVGLVIYVFVFGALLLQRYATARRMAEQLRLQILQAQSEERRRVGRDLHDGVAQDLQGMRFLMDQMQSETTLSEPGSGHLQQIAHGLRLAIQEVRRLAADLTPPREALTRLDTSLAALAVDMAERFQVQVHTTLPVMPELSAVLTENVYRLAQEAVRNACRHSGSREVWLKLALDRQQLMLSIRDAGRGFDPREVSTGRLGVRGMRERAALIGGNLTLKTTLGHGTEIIVSIPWYGEPHAQRSEIRFKPR